jgi:hypothetical protein
MIEIYERISRPNLLLQFIAGDHFTWILQQSLKDQEWLLLKANPQAAFSQLAGAKVQLEIVEANEL